MMTSVVEGPDPNDQSTRISRND